MLHITARLYADGSAYLDQDNEHNKLRAANIDDARSKIIAIVREQAASRNDTVMLSVREHDETIILKVTASGELVEDTDTRPTLTIGEPVIQDIPSETSSPVEPDTKSPQTRTLVLWTTQHSKQQKIIALGLLLSMVLVVTTIGSVRLYTTHQQEQAYHTCLTSREQYQQALNSTPPELQPSPVTKVGACASTMAASTLQSNSDKLQAATSDLLAQIKTLHDKQREAQAKKQEAQRAAAKQKLEDSLCEAAISAIQVGMQAASQAEQQQAAPAPQPQSTGSSTPQYAPTPQQSNPPENWYIPPSQDGPIFPDHF